MFRWIILVACRLSWHSCQGCYVNNCLFKLRILCEIYKCYCRLNSISFFVKLWLARELSRVISLAPYIYVGFYVDSNIPKAATTLLLSNFKLVYSNVSRSTRLSTLWNYVALIEAETSPKTNCSSEWVYSEQVCGRSNRIFERWRIWLDYFHL
jgi:hypothetical protein